jgi:hydroxymethylbilane synthase
MKHFPNRPLTIVCRTSNLAVIQAERAKALILRHFPDATLHILTKESAGDKNTTAPLYTLEGRDFFTKDIDDYLLSGEADFAVHSLKDLSLERTEDPAFVSAVFERDDPRDVVLFAPGALEKLTRGETLTLGTSSLRRMELVPKFLQKALPQLAPIPPHPNTAPRVRCEAMRGNVDSRLKQLADGKFDGIILAVAGLNRLLASPKNHDSIHALLASFRMMILPLVECPPAPGQGALIIETLAKNTDAVAVVERLRTPSLESELAPERSLLRDFGGGCHQRFGAVNLPLASGSTVLIANGKASNDQNVESMRFDVPDMLKGKRIFAASDFMKDFFTTSYEAVSEDFELSEKAIFISHHRAAHNETVLKELRQKRIWTAGTRTWFELAKRGVWVEGCSDGFGFRFLEGVFSSPLVGLNPHTMRILTNTESAQDWLQDGFPATGLYTLHDNISAGIRSALGEADAFFWTSFGQYRACREYISPEKALHICPSGRTAAIFRSHGIEPVIVPSIKAFLLWQKTQQ